VDVASTNHGPIFVLGWAVTPWNPSLGMCLPIPVQFHHSSEWLWLCAIWEKALGPPYPAQAFSGTDPYVIDTPVPERSLIARLDNTVHVLQRLIFCKDMSENH
jgi:hypothetical protein